MYKSRLLSLQPLWQFLALVTLLGANSSFAEEQLSLKAFLDRASKDGYSILYSSDLILPRYQVTIDPEKKTTITRLETALAGFDLQLKRITTKTYTVIRQKEETILLVDEINLFSLNIEELVVTSSKHQIMLNTQISHASLGQADLRSRPALGNDAIRLVNHLPGSASVGISAQPNVRGGNKDETLILFDGITLYEPFHLNSFNNLFGSFDARIIDNIDFYSGGFTSQFGDRLSAAMVINTREDQDLQSIREIGLGFYNLSYLQSGTRGSDTWMINARRSTIELLTGLSELNIGKPTFADIFARYSMDLNENHVLKLNVFWFGDDTELNKESANETLTNIYGNTYLWAKSEYELSDELYLESYIGFSAIKNDRKGSITKPHFATGNLIDDRKFSAYFLKQSFEYLYQSDMFFQFGWEYRYLTAQYTYESKINIDPLFQSISNYDRPLIFNASLDETGHQYNLYFSHKWIMTNKLSAEIGLRFDGQHYENSLTSRQYNPRLSVLYQYSNNSAFRFSWGRFSQAEGIHELKIEDGLTDFQEAQALNHIVLGWKFDLSIDTSLNIEAYRKTGTEINTYYQNLTNPLTLLPELQPDRYQISPTRLESKGLEISLRGTWRGINYWANTSYASAKDSMTGTKVNRSWDQKHSSNIGIQFEMKKWHIAFSGSMHDGWPTTRLSLIDNEVQVIERNSIRLDDFSSWDIKASRTWDIAHHSLRLEIGITNIFDKVNQVGIDFEVEDGELTSGIKTGLPTLPFIDLYWRF
ncbi:MAG: TonB-dependent receptor plug domain-containing protein [Pseudomonadales bacterium]|nr:TonB-dependent receptor plug domain-containing protein [Pseudomonadales bacterium]